MRKLLVAFLLCAGVARAQVDITAQNKKAVTLMPGGPAQTIRFNGTNFESVREIWVIKDNKRIRDGLRSKLKRVGKGLIDLELQAASELPPGEYRLNFIYAKDHDRVPVQVTVADPHPPQPSPTPRPEPTPRDGWFHP